MNIKNLLLLGVGANISIVIGAVALIAVIFLIVCLAIRNRILRLKNRIGEGWATVDVQLKKRYDLIPNLVETVRGYAWNESQTLERVVSACNIAIEAQGENKIDAEVNLNAALRSLFALKEQYPDLKASANFLNLQTQLREVETEIASARHCYNDTVRALNTKIDMFPSNLVARRMKVEKSKYFEVDSEEERKNIKAGF